MIISEGTIAAEAPHGSDPRVISASGCTVIPGLIDAHAHLQWNLSPAEMFSASLDYLASLVLVEAKATLMRGFTSVRDISGQVLGAKKAIDEGHFVGPRIWSCCGMRFRALHSWTWRSLGCSRSP